MPNVLFSTRPFSLGSPHRTCPGVVSIVAGLLLAAWPAAAIRVEIETTLDRRPIDPRIYGVNFGSSEAIDDVPYPFRRWGGNAVTRYNWQSDTSQTASDYFFQSIVGDVADPSVLPSGSASDRFLEETLALGREPLLTVPTIGWTSAGERVKKWSFSVARYGPQTVDECTFYGANPPFWCTADSGNGECDPQSNQTGFCVGGRIVGNDPTDASLAIDSDFVSGWIAHLRSRFGSAAEGGVRNFALDNEPMLWHETHRDVHPTPASYDEVWNRSLEIARAIKQAEPDAVVFGPAVWGWCAYFSSAADLVGSGPCTDGPDRAAHAGKAFLPWLLEQVCLTEASTGQRPIDVLDVHFYPQANVSGLGGASDSEAPADAARRLRSVKALYDPVYVSESWIGEPVALIPRLRGWIDAECPGLGLAISEYRWGTDEGASSALAHAEVLAIFGREGVDMATRWVAPERGSKVEDAFRLYLDYDGSGGRVSGDSVRTTSADVDAVGAYGVVGSHVSGDEVLQLLLFNKSTLAHGVELEIDASLTSDLSLYRFDADTALAAVGSLPAAPTPLELTLPPRSATLAVATISVPEPVAGAAWLASLAMSTALAKRRGAKGRGAKRRRRRRADCGERVGRVDAVERIGRGREDASRAAYRFEHSAGGASAHSRAPAGSGLGDRSRDQHDDAGRSRAGRRCRGDDRRCAVRCG